MTGFQELIQNKYIIVPMFIWLGIQIFKTVWDLIKEKKYGTTYIYIYVKPLFRIFL